MNVMTTGNFLPVLLWTRGNRKYHKFLQVSSCDESSGSQQDKGKTVRSINRIGRPRAYVNFNMCVVILLCNRI
jgi:hypothetical protein